MKRAGVVHAELARQLARLGHTDRFVIADRGLPLPRNLPVIDLALRPGLISFCDALDAVLGEVVVQSHVLAVEAVTAGRFAGPAANPVELWLTERGVLLGPGTPVPHEAFKRLLHDDKVVFAIRTGEETAFANVILEAGVPF